MIIILKNKNCGQTIMLFMYKFAEAINYMEQNNYILLERLFYQSVFANGNKYDHNPYHTMTVLLEYIDRFLKISMNEYILILRRSWKFSVLHAINVFYLFPIMLVLCSMLLLTHYAQINYAGIIGGSLVMTMINGCGPR